jgi:hypothetical protein
VTLLAYLLALWTALASVTPVVVEPCAAAACRCCGADDRGHTALGRPPCCERGDAQAPASAPVTMPEAGTAFVALPLAAVDERPVRSADDRSPPRARSVARGPPWRALGRLLL